MLNESERYRVTTRRLLHVALHSQMNISILILSELFKLESFYKASYCFILSVNYSAKPICQLFFHRFIQYFPVPVQNVLKISIRALICKLMGNNMSSLCFLDATVLCCPHCSQLSTIWFSIVEPESAHNQV